MIEHKTDPCYALAVLASSCLIEEVNLTPKPGLVDRRGCGSHTDLSVDLMEKSARALESSFEEIARESWGKPIDLYLREAVGAIGREGEKRMLRTTGGVNTHRGALWVLGLLVSTVASGKCTDSICDTLQKAAELSRLPDRAADQETKGAESHGLRVRRLFKMPGAREEAQNGFPHIAKKALPSLYESRKRGISETHARLNALLAIMTTLSDTCVLTRSGPDGLARMHELANQTLYSGGMGTANGEKKFYQLDSAMREMNASPGGAADLLAGTLFLDQLPGLSL